MEREIGREAFGEAASLEQAIDYTLTAGTAQWSDVGLKGLRCIRPGQAAIFLRRCSGPGQRERFRATLRPGRHRGDPPGIALESIVSRGGCDAL